MQLRASTLLESPVFPHDKNHQSSSECLCIFASLSLLLQLQLSNALKSNKRAQSINRVVKQSVRLEHSKQVAASCCVSHFRRLKGRPTQTGSLLNFFGATHSNWTQRCQSVGQWAKSAKIQWSIRVSTRVGFVSAGKALIWPLITMDSTRESRKIVQCNHQCLLRRLNWMASENYRCVNEIQLALYLQLQFTFVDPNGSMKAPWKLSALKSKLARLGRQNKMNPFASRHSLLEWHLKWKPQPNNIKLKHPRKQRLTAKSICSAQLRQRLWLSVCNFNALLVKFRCQSGECKLW